MKPFPFIEINKKYFADKGYLVVALGLTILFFYPLLFSKKTLFFRDIHLWFYPMKNFLSNSIKYGDIPFWCPKYFCGTPFISNIQSGVFYPLSVIFLLSPFFMAFNLFVVIHFFLAFCFFYLFQREIGISRKAAIISSISFCYGGYIISSVNLLNNLSTAIWLPAILWAITRALHKKQPKGFFLCILFLVIMILGGEPQLFILSSILLFFYSLTLIDKVHAPIYYLKTSTILSLLVLCSICICLINLGPLFFNYQLSARMGGITYDEATRHSLSPEMLKHLLMPLKFKPDFGYDSQFLTNFYPGEHGIPWLMTIYPGFFIFPFAMVAVLFVHSRKILLWSIVFVASLLMALGHHTPFYRSFYVISPFFRFPEKFMLTANFSLLILSAYGMDIFFKKFTGKWLANFCFSFLAIFLVMDLTYANGSLNLSFDNKLYNSNHNYLKPINMDKGLFRIYVDPDCTSISKEGNSLIAQHLAWQMSLIPNSGIVQDFSYVNGFTALELRYQYIINQLLNRPWKEKIRFLKLANVKYVITTRDLKNEPKLDVEVEQISPVVYEIKNTMPRAWIAGNLQKIKTGTIDDIISESFIPENTVLAEGNIADQYNTPSYKKVEHITYKKSSRIYIRLKPDENGVLVLSESSYPGWKVYVDGKQRECLWLNLLFQGVEVKNGDHIVEFVYRPKYFYIFASISIISLSIFILVWFLAIFSATKSKSAPLK